MDQQNTTSEKSPDESLPEESDGSPKTAPTQIILADAAPLPATWENGKEKDQPLLQICNLTLRTPQNTVTLVDNLSLDVNRGDHLLVRFQVTLTSNAVSDADVCGSGWSDS